MKTRIHSVILILLLGIFFMAISVFASEEKGKLESTEQEIAEMSVTFLESPTDSNDAEIFEDVPAEEKHLPEIEIYAEEDAFTETLEETEVLEEAETSETENIFSEESADFNYAMFTSENAELLEGAQGDDQELVQRIQQGEVIAVAPVLASDIALTEGVEIVSEGNEAVLTALNEGQYKLVSAKKVYCDEVWTETNDGYPCKENGASYTDSRHRMSTTFRRIYYVDCDGNEKSSVLYCMNASLAGLNPGSSGTMLKEEAVSFISNSTIKKILYFGFGGPRDICDEYNPACTHIDWSNWHNRFVFTHYALSKIYSGDLGHATEAEAEHIGLNRFITKIKSKTIPSRNGVKLSSEKSDGTVQTANPLTVNLILYDQRPAGEMSWVDDTYENGFQITAPIKVTDDQSDENGMVVNCSENANWQLVYWKTESEYQETRGPERPRILAKGNSVTLKEGAVFRIVFPLQTAGTLKYTYDMYLKPVKYLLVDGKVQTSQSGYQNWGAFVYQGTRGKVRLYVNAAPYGSLSIFKKDSMTGNPLPGAVCKLYAAEDLYSEGVRRYRKNEVIREGTTDADGNLTFSCLLPGKYYVKETASPEGYLLSSEIISITVSAGKTAQAEIWNTPDIIASVEIEKLVSNTSLHLTEAEFTIYAWDESRKEYSGSAQIMVYDSEKKRYLSPVLVYTESNKGRFKIVETKNPPGYSGTWSQEVVLNEPGKQQSFKFVVENELSDEKKVEIQKVDAQSSLPLTDAEFMIYEYSAALQDYAKPGTKLQYDSLSMKYQSEALVITDDNQGKFYVEESKNPPGYTGNWGMELDITNTSQVLQYTVKNTKIEYPRGRILLHKQDSYTGEVLTGAQFRIYEWNRETNAYEDVLGADAVLSYETADGCYLSQWLEINEKNEGKFKVVETKAPEGYSGDWKQEVQMNDIQKEYEYTLTNDPLKLPAGKITLIKKIKEQDIIWAHGNPIFSFVIEGKDIRGITRRYEEYAEFTTGNYAVDEDGYATLKVIFSNIPIGEYQIYEKPVLRYYLADMYANTQNAAIWHGKEPAYGVNPKEIAYATVVLQPEELWASVTFVNEKSRYDDYTHNSAVKNFVSVS